MKSLKVIVLMHGDLIPPHLTLNEKEEVIQSPPSLDKSKRLETHWTTEHDVISQLYKMGHKVRPLGVISDLKKMREAIESYKPHIVFNLLEEFDGESLFDSHVVSYLELLGVPYTGNNPRGLMLARDKAVTKKILSYHRIKSAKFAVFPKNRSTKVPKHLSYPLIVKCLSEDASLGLSKASIVHNEEKLKERIKYIHQKLGVDAIVEEFISGREFYVGVLGNYRLDTLPVWEVFYEKSEHPEKEFYSRSAKWNEKYRQRKGIESGKAKLSSELEAKIQDVARRTYKVLGLNGYARIDVRMDDNGAIYVIEANPNPNIASDDEFAESSFVTKKWDYSKVLQKILSLGISWSQLD